MVLVFFALVFPLIFLLFKHGILSCNCLVTFLSPQTDYKQQKPNSAK